VIDTSEKSEKYFYSLHSYVTKNPVSNILDNPKINYVKEG